jgi:hypothetical protein
MCLPCPARVPNITMHLNRRRMSPVHPTFTLRPGDGERWTNHWGSEATTAVSCIICP